LYREVLSPFVYSNPTDLIDDNDNNFHTPQIGEIVTYNNNDNNDSNHTSSDTPEQQPPEPPPVVTVGTNMGYVISIDNSRGVVDVEQCGIDGAVTLTLILNLTLR
jgi:hypothetical protein